MADEPCYSSWVINTSVCSAWASYSPADQAWGTRLAIFVLWGATGRRYGACPTTVRPCWQRKAPLYQTWNVGLQGEGYWGLRGGPVSGGVTLFGGDCGCSGGCACTPDQVLLPGAVQAVTQVVVDGVALAPTEYLLQGSWLVRAAGQSWPALQDYSLPTTAAGTWAVTYTEGEVPPDVLLDAAGTYACELIKGKNGSACLLPRKVQSVSRQGVDIQFVDTSDYLDQGLTGVEPVDTVIRTINPHGLRRAPRVLSPDLPQYR